MPFGTVPSPWRTAAPLWRCFQYSVVHGSLSTWLGSNRMRMERTWAMSWSSGLPLWHQCCLLQPTLYQIMEAGRPVAAKHSSLWLRAHFPTSSLHQHCPVWLRDSGRNVLNLTASRDSLCVPGKGGAHTNRRVKSPRVGWNKNCKGNLIFCRFLNYKWVNATYKAAVFNAIFRLSKLDTRELKELRGMVKNACTV